ncbi:MAG: ABC transporter permease, partial [Planctomycetota bacterium]
MLRLVLTYLFRRPVQLLAILGVAVGLLALLSVLAVMNGLINMNTEAVRGPLGDLMLIPAVSEELPRWVDYEAALMDAEGVEAVAPHLVAYAMYSLPGYIVDLSDTQRDLHRGIQVIGIDMEAERKVNNFTLELERARIMPVADQEQPFAKGPGIFARPTVLVSDAFATTLRTDPDGERTRMELGALPAVLPAAGEPLIPHNARVEIGGTFGGSDFRSAMDRVYMERTGRDGLHYNLLGTSAADFTEALIKIEPDANPAAVKEAILASLDRAGLPRPGLEQGGILQTWEERSSLVLHAIHNERRVVTLVMFFIVVVAAFGLFATLSTLVREKIRDLGILAAVGYSPMRRGLLMLTTGGVASFIGCLMGYFGAYQLIKHRHQVEDWVFETYGYRVFRPDLYVVDGLPAQWDDGEAIFLTCLTLGVGLLFTAAPALRARARVPCGGRGG